MAGVFIYKDVFRKYFSFVIVDDTYAVAKSNTQDRGGIILWEREGVSLEQIEDSRKTKDDLVRRLNKGQEVDLEKELLDYFN